MNEYNINRRNKMVSFNKCRSTNQRDPYNQIKSREISQLPALEENLHSKLKSFFIPVKLELALYNQGYQNVNQFNKKCACGFGELIPIISF